MKYNHQKSAKDILNEIYGALQNFRSSAERKDDETLVVIKALYPFQNPARQCNTPSAAKAAARQKKE